MNTAVHKSSFSFSRAYRLTTKADFTAVFEEQLKVSQPWFLALYRKNQRPHARVGVVISKRNVKKATARNSLKRLIREGFRLHCREMDALDLVIIARRGCNIENKAKVQKELATLWQHLRSL